MAAASSLQDSTFFAKQTTETLGLNGKEFEHNYRVDVTDPAGGFLPGVFAHIFPTPLLMLNRQRQCSVSTMPSAKPILALPP